MVFFSRVKHGSLPDFGHNRPGEPAGFLKLFPGCFGKSFLCVVKIENSRPILISDINELSVGGSWINIHPEDIQ